MESGFGAHGRRSSVYVTHVEISDVRGFGGRQKVDLPLSRPGGSPAGWTVVAGRNGAGKSTFLRTIALALAGPFAARSLQESFAGWIREGGEIARVSVEVEYDNTVDRFEKTGRLPKKRFFAGLQWRRLKGAEPTVEEFSKAKTMRQTPLRGPWSEQPRGWFVAGYGPFRRLTGHASDAQRLMVGPNHLPRLVSLFREDASLLECVQWLKDLYLRRLEGRSEASRLEEATLRLLNDGMLPGGLIVTDVDSDGLWLRQAGARLPLQDLSDGYRTMIALVLDIVRHMQACYGEVPVSENSNGHMSVDLPGVVLIDEIDVHLHVSWQQRVGFWLKQRFPRVQFIVSSHSPFICQAADVGGLIRLPAPGQDARAEHVSTALHKRIVRGTADEVALTELFGLESTRTEETERLMEELARLEGQVVRGEISAAGRQRYQKLQLELPLTTSAAVENALRSLSEPGYTHEAN
jgi:hypothetical protein